MCVLDDDDRLATESYLSSNRGASLDVATKKTIIVDAGDEGLVRISGEAST